MKQLEFAGLNYLRSLPELNSAEHAELNKILQSSVVIKYLNLTILRAARDLALTEALGAAKDPNSFLIHQAFVKGVISVADTLLSAVQPLPGKDQ